MDLNCLRYIAKKRPLHRSEVNRILRKYEEWNMPLRTHPFTLESPPQARRLYLLDRTPMEDRNANFVDYRDDVDRTPMEDRNANFVDYRNDGLAWKPLKSPSSLTIRGTVAIYHATAYPEGHGLTRHCYWLKSNPYINLVIYVPVKAPRLPTPLPNAEELGVKYTFRTRSVIDKRAAHKRLLTHHVYKAIVFREELKFPISPCFNANNPPKDGTIYLMQNENDNYKKDCYRWWPNTRTFSLLKLNDVEVLQHYKVENEDRIRHAYHLKGFPNLVMVHYLRKIQVEQASEEQEEQASEDEEEQVDLLPRSTRYNLRTLPQVRSSNQASTSSNQASTSSRFKNDPFQLEQWAPKFCHKSDMGVMVLLCGRMDETVKKSALWCMVGDKKVKVQFSASGISFSLPEYDEQFGDKVDLKIIDENSKLVTQRRLQFRYI